MAAASDDNVARIPLDPDVDFGPDDHSDPFDRLLIAQAMVENLLIITCDEKFAPYGVSLIW